MRSRLTAGSRRGGACARRRRLIAAGYALTLRSFYPGVMTYDAKIRLRGYRQGRARRLAIPPS